MDFDSDSPFCEALKDWSKAANVPWNSACWHAVAAWESQTIPALDMPTGPADTLPKIVGLLRAKGTTFRNVRFALGCVRTAITEWKQTTVPPWVSAPTGGSSGQETPDERAARAVARVEARLAREAKGKT